MSLKIACATNDGTYFYDGHFGDAPKYELYNITPEKYTKIDEITNISPEKRKHGDPQKAQSIITIMKNRGVEALVNKKFGSNITKIKKKFLTIVVSDDEINIALGKIAERYDEIRKTLDSVDNKSDGYDVIYIRH